MSKTQATAVPVICYLCKESIEDHIIQYLFIDGKIQARHTNSYCQRELKFKPPDMYMKRIDQTKWD